MRLGGFLIVCREGLILNSLSCHSEYFDFVKLSIEFSISILAMFTLMMSSIADSSWDDWPQFSWITASCLTICYK